jgi:hypothetical protein
MKLKNHLWKVCLAEAPVELEDLSFGVLQLLRRGVNLQPQVHHPANVHKVQDLEPMRAGIGVNSYLWKKLHRRQN